MDDVAKSHTNKLLRVKLGQRLSLPELNDSMHWIERTFQAKCPTKGTPVSVAIPCERVSIEPAEVQEILCTALITQSDQQLWVVPHPSRIGGVVVHVYKIERLAVVHVAGRDSLMRSKSYLPIGRKRLSSMIWLSRSPRMRSERSSKKRLQKV
jgi:hypothetical protein